MLSSESCFEIKEKLGTVDFGIYDAAVVNKEAAFILKHKEDGMYSPKYPSCDYIFNSLGQEQIKQNCADKEIEKELLEYFSFHHIDPVPEPYYKECVGRLEELL